MEREGEWDGNGNGMETEFLITTKFPTELGRERCVLHASGDVVGTMSDGVSRSCWSMWWGRHSLTHSLTHSLPLCDDPSACVGQPTPCTMPCMHGVLLACWPVGPIQLCCVSRTSGPQCGVYALRGRGRGDTHLGRTLVDGIPSKQYMQLHIRWMDARALDDRRSASAVGMLNAGCWMPNANCPPRHRPQQQARSSAKPNQTDGAVRRGRRS